MPGPMQLLVILVIVILLFGTKRLKNIGSDLGGALKGFKKAIKDKDEEKEESTEENKDSKIIEGEVIKKTTAKEEKVEK